MSVVLIIEIHFGKIVFFITPYGKAIGNGMGVLRFLGISLHQLAFEISG